MFTLCMVQFPGIQAGPSLPILAFGLDWVLGSASPGAAMTSSAHGISLCHKRIQ